MNTMKKLISLLLLLSLLLSLASCVEHKPPLNNDKPGVATKPELDDDPTNDFTVTLRLNEQPFTPSAAIDVYWSDGFDISVAPVDENGVARIDGLDGDYRITLSSVPSGYTYDVNGYKATNFKRNIVLDMYDLNFVMGEGTSLTDTKEFSTTGVYSVTINSPEDWVYFEFSPKFNGIYTIESWASVTDDEVNPVARQHVGSTASGAFFGEEEVTTTGQVGSFTRNFLYTVKIADEHISSVGGGSNTYVFSVSAETKSGIYPVTYSFAVKRDGGFDLGGGGKVMVPVKADMSHFDFDAFNALAGGNITYAETIYKDKNGVEQPGAYVFDEDNYRLWEISDGGDGVYHVYDEEKYASTGGYGPVLVAFIGASTRFLESFISMGENAPSNPFSVSTTEDYRHFIMGYESLVSQGYYCVGECKCHDASDPNKSCPPGSPNCHANCRPCPEGMESSGGYAAWCNDDGVAPVTEELKGFLQKFSTSKRCFADGDGFAEKSGIYAYEDSQWLFACGYYE